MIDILPAGWERRTLVKTLSLPLEQQTAWHIELISYLSISLYTYVMTTILSSLRNLSMGKHPWSG